MTPDETRRYREKVEAMDDAAFAEEVERQSFLAARVTQWSDYDERCEILIAVNTPLYDAVRMRLQLSLLPR